MCEFCENTKRPISLLNYDNRDSMRISFGQYQGVFVDADLKMLGNMLILGASGSYRSDFDCYYDAEGLDIDNTPGARSKNRYMQIKYCPFCGKEIKNTVFEKQKVNDDIYDLKRKLALLERDLKWEKMIINFTWNLNKRTPEEIDKMVEEFKKEEEKKGYKVNETGYRNSIQYKQDKYDTPFTLEEM